MLDLHLSDHFTSFVSLLRKGQVRFIIFIGSHRLVTSCNSSIVFAVWPEWVKITHGIFEAY